MANSRPKSSTGARLKAAGSGQATSPRGTRPKSTTGTRPKATLGSALDSSADAAKTASSAKAVPANGVQTKTRNQRPSQPQRGADSQIAGLNERISELEDQNFLLEDQVRQLHRVKTIVDLLAGVSHDLSSALTGIVWCSEAVRGRIAAFDQDLSAGLTDFVNAADYARRLARRLISIGRQRDDQFGVCRLEPLVEEAASLAETLRPRSIELHTYLNAPDAWVWGNSDQLQQIIVNLATNAFDATNAKGGRVDLKLEEGEMDDDGELRPCARITVIDTGTGMTAETLARAFEPFFTTKGPQDGNGLGLVVVRMIVERHGGRVRALSKPNQGTTMEVELPLTDAPSLSEP
jgi:signal transduction histidine kinase